VLKVLSHFSIVKRKDTTTFSKTDFGNADGKAHPDNQSNHCGWQQTRFDWKEAWYPVHYIVDLDRSNRFTLLGQDPSSGGIDRQHVGGSLKTSVPTVWCTVGGTDCGRWAVRVSVPQAFRGDGMCDRIPRLQGAPLTSPNCVASLPTAERGLALCLPRSTGKCS